MIFQPIYEDAWALEDIVFFAFIIILLLSLIFPLGPALQKYTPNLHIVVDAIPLTQ